MTIEAIKTISQLDAIAERAAKIGRPLPENVRAGVARDIALAERIDRNVRNGRKFTLNDGLTEGASVLGADATLMGIRVKTSKGTRYIGWGDAERFANA